MPLTEMGSLWEEQVLREDQKSAFGPVLTLGYLHRNQVKMLREDAAVKLEFQKEVGLES